MGKHGGEPRGAGFVMSFGLASSCVFTGRMLGLIGGGREERSGSGGEATRLSGAVGNKNGRTHSGGFSHKSSQTRI